jgi:hypothetical protein
LGSAATLFEELKFFEIMKDWTTHLQTVSARDDVLSSFTNKLLARVGGRVAIGPMIALATNRQPARTIRSCQRFV